MTKIQKRNILICLLTRVLRKQDFLKIHFFNETKSWMNLVETHFCKDKEIILIYNKYQKLWITGIHIFYELNTCILLWMFVLHTGHCQPWGHTSDNNICVHRAGTPPPPQRPDRSYTSSAPVTTGSLQPVL